MNRLQPLTGQSVLCERGNSADMSMVQTLIEAYTNDGGDSLREFQGGWENVAQPLED
ncbi:MAG: hypothetical protein HQ445_11830 [Polaromonas sp.]|nr:hypothetical protein [Polaromonas sp.]